MTESAGHARGDHVVDGVDWHGRAAVVRLAGELGLHSAADARDALLRTATEQPERLVIDLTAVDFLDSTALGVLVEVRSKLADRRRFLLAAPGLEARRALEVSGLVRHFAVYEAVESALEAVLD